jgi:hypothetical protein
MTTMIDKSFAQFRGQISVKNRCGWHYKEKMQKHKRTAGEPRIHKLMMRAGLLEASEVVSATSRFVNVLQKDFEISSKCVRPDEVMEMMIDDVVVVFCFLCGVRCGRKLRLIILLDSVVIIHKFCACCMCSSGDSDECPIHRHGHWLRYRKLAP